MVKHRNAMTKIPTRCPCVSDKRFDANLPVDCGLYLMSSNPGTCHMLGSLYSTHTRVDWLIWGFKRPITSTSSSKKRILSCKKIIFRIIPPWLDFQCKIKHRFKLFWFWWDLSKEFLQNKTRFNTQPNLANQQWKICKWV